MKSLFRTPGIFSFAQRWKKAAAVLLSFLVVPVPARAFDLASFFDLERSSAAASPVESVWHGLQVGAGISLSAGWLRYGRAGNSADFWKSGGMGALSGMLIGAGAELTGSRAFGNRLLAGMEVGGRVGGLAGLVWGAADGFSADRTERIGDDGAWGQLAGAGFGLIYAGYQILAGNGAEETDAPRASSELGCIPDSSGAFLLTFKQRF